MSVVIETTIGDITVDLFLKERPRACLNFIKLCRLKYYNFNLFHTIQEQFIGQTGDPTGKGDGGESVWGVLEGTHKRYFEAETVPKIKHSEPGLLSMVSDGSGMIGSQFFFTLGSDLISLDGVHCVIGEVAEGHEILAKLNEAICDAQGRPYKDIRITHTVVLEDPFNDPRGFRQPSRSPSPTPKRLQGGRIAADEDIDDTHGKTEEEINEMIADKEAKARATILEIVGDIPDAEVAPPENVLFVCKLNPVTTDEDLQIIFSRFGIIKNAEVIRDRVSGDSLQYAFIEFEDKKSCEEAYFKMDNVLIDDRRIHVDFSQSVSKIKWRGKGRWTINDDEEMEKSGGRKKNVDQRRDDRRRRSPGSREYSSRSNYDRRDDRRDRNYRDRQQSYDYRGDRSNSRRERSRSMDRRRNDRDRSRDRNRDNRRRDRSSDRNRESIKSSDRRVEKPSRHHSEKKSRSRSRPRRDESNYEKKRKNKPSKKRPSSSSSSSSSSSASSNSSSVSDHSNKKKKKEKKKSRKH